MHTENKKIKEAQEQIWRRVEKLLRQDHGEIRITKRNSEVRVEYTEKSKVDFD